MKNVGFILVILCGIVLAFTSCDPDRTREDSDTLLSFSTDTLSFDTVFTTLGSATRSFKVYNPYNEIVNISNIELQDNAEGFFRLNIDGKTGNKDTNIEILPNDSIYIFAEVTIDPDQPLSSSPFFIEDKISFQTNGNTQEILLLAWGQNANYIPSSKNKGGQALLSCDFQSVTWDDVKPYVIYGILVIDSCELVIPEGADIYVHGGVAFNDEGAPYNDGVLVVLKDGKLTVKGTAIDPVTIQGDRLESVFDDVPGQWGGIILADEATGSEFRYTTIKNSIVGVRVDSLADAKLYNCQFLNQSANGLLGFHSGSIYAENCLFANSGSSAVSLQYGGNYELNFCTLASFNSGNTSLSASNFRCTEPTCLGPKLYNDLDMKFKNCIINGDQADQISFIDGSDTPADFVYDLQNCIVQVEELLESDDFVNFFDFCNPCENVTVMDSVLLDPLARIYSLDTMSVARDYGIDIGIDLDILGINRDPVNPDVGCFEFVE